MNRTQTPDIHLAKTFLRVWWCVWTFTQEGVPLEPPALQFSVHVSQKVPEKNWHTTPKKSEEYNKWLAFNNDDRMLMAVTRDFLENH